MGPFIGRFGVLGYGASSKSIPYKAAVAQLGPATQHHNSHNAHHPERHPNGVEDMTLIDLMEMLADWKAASERGQSGSMDKSIALCATKYSIPSPIVNVLRNTAKAMGWDRLGGFSHFTKNYFAKGE